MAEIDAGKQKYLSKRFPGTPIFNDVCDMSRSFAGLWDGGSAEVDLLVAGFPCVSISNLTTTPGSITDVECSSGKGYRGMENYVKKKKPSLLLLENVAAVYAKRGIEGGESAFAILQRRIERMGYVVAGGLHNTADFGLPQQRNRAWILCIKSDETDSPPALITSDVNAFLRLNAKLDARVNELKALAVGCTRREISILAVAVEELLVTKQFDAMTQLTVIQVETWSITHVMLLYG
eukprot:Skav220439  [mRNA]  locus=scaffold2346:63672:65232:+ [translate_table: standard]